MAKLIVSLAPEDLEASFDDLDEHAASNATEAMATPVIPRIFLSFIILSFEIDCFYCNRIH